MAFRTSGQYSQVNQQLLELEERLQWRNRLYTRLHGVEELLAEQKERGEELAAVLNKEREDVVRLEQGRGLTALFVALTGSKEERLDKERREYLAARLEHDECCTSIERLQQEVARTRQQIEDLGDIRDRQRDLLELKEQLIARGDAPDSQQLVHLDDRLAKARAAIKELKEALEAGNAAYDLLMQIIELLDSARARPRVTVGPRGTGGVPLKTRWYKETELARKLANRAQSLLRIFERELADVGIVMSSQNVRFESFASFTRGFWHEMMDGWQIESALINARNRVTDAAHVVWDLLAKMAGELERTERKAEQLHQQREALIRSL